MPQTYFDAKNLMTAPIERAAFSDRMAYLCAELSKLAYFKFEGGHPLAQATELIDTFITDQDSAAKLKEGLALIITQMPGTQEQSKAVLKEILQAEDFTLEETFSIGGTQAFICTRLVNYPSGSTKKVAYLAFRGTEPKEFQDIKTDINARLKPVELGKETVEFHKGFYEAYKLVEKEIINTLDNLKYDQLFITGHSLGGALAMMATRILPYEIRGACYTFGAPPIGTIQVQNGLKTPVYEIVNETDIVPCLPNPWAAWGTIIILHLVKLLLRPITGFNQFVFGGNWDERLVEYMKQMTKYEHPGYLSYLQGSGKEARLRYQMSFFRRAKIRLGILWKQKFGGFKKMAQDHSIDLYVEKLRNHGDRRN
ncbi:lipase family protein [Kordiimonas sp. SCSIO 12603]|uniref:lipase family protein n=1 Tax=Kordiimonas sp. SCSIO 12603 TaxID=2829596 RepID=UPI0021084EEC|nr:lipase family protein [Kordiimonas sp. SCSIO 12603]UTW59048.1 lipase family protein [Kordiimonas sp. SCSIO 12603]